MENLVFMSIKKQHIENILNKNKNHEFRTRIPNKKVDYIIVYVPTPIKELKYILKVNNPIKTPSQIKIEGKGNKEFNVTKKLKYAYPIKNVYEINVALNLKELKDKFNFTAPQSFAYGEKYRDLLEYIKKVGITKLY